MRRAIDGAASEGCAATWNDSRGADTVIGQSHMSHKGVSTQRWVLQLHADLPSTGPSETRRSSADGEARCLVRCGTTMGQAAAGGSAG